MAQKQTSERMSKIAARVLAAGSLFDNEDYANPIREAAAEAGLSAKKTEEILLPRLQAVLAPYVATAMSLAGSVLSQDEKGKSRGDPATPAGPETAEDVAQPESTPNEA